MFGLGIIVGPAGGRALYSLGGYASPFLVSGAAEVTLSILSLFLFHTSNHSADSNATQVSREKESLLSDKREKNNECKSGTETANQNDGGFFKVISRPLMIMTILPHMNMSGSVAYIDVAVGPYLEKYFGIGGDFSGYYFLTFSLAFALASPLIGALIDGGHGTRVYLTFSFFAGAG